MWKKLGVVAASLVALVVVVVVYASTKPDTFHVERTVTVNAAPEKIYPHIEDFHQWNGWSPYEKLDPALVRTFSGAPKGVGAIYQWKGNGKAGEGKMEITEASPPNRLIVKLDFTAPFVASNVATFRVEPSAAGSNVTWAMDGQNSLFSKVLGVFFDMDKLLGKDFEAGLGNLKALAEK